MTGVLLDTHAYVWAVSAPERLPDGVRTLLEDAATPVLVSAASAWEMAIKHRAGTWPEAEPLLRAHDRLLQRLRAESLPVDGDDAIHAGGLTWAHQDPFDRMVATQAMRRGLTLISRDAAFRELPGLQVDW